MSATCGHVPAIVRFFLAAFGGGELPGKWGLLSCSKIKRFEDLCKRLDLAASFGPANFVSPTPFHRNFDHPDYHSIVLCTHSKIIRFQCTKLSNMTIEQQCCLYASDISLCLEDETMPAFRRSCSAPGCLSASPQKVIDTHRSWESTHPRSSIDDSPAESRSSSELRHLRALHDIRSRIIKKEDHPCTFFRSRSCGFEDVPSFVHMIQNHDAMISSDNDFNGGVCLNDVCGGECISTNFSLNDTSPNDTTCCSCLPVRDTAAIDVDISRQHPMDSVELVTWNLASPNNNPFEFWVRRSKHSHSCHSCALIRTGCLAGDSQS